MPSKRFLQIHKRNLSERHINETQRYYNDKFRTYDNKELQRKARGSDDEDDDDNDSYNDNSIPIDDEEEDDDNYDEYNSKNFNNRHDYMKEDRKKAQSERKLYTQRKNTLKEQKEGKQHKSERTLTSRFHVPSNPLKGLLNHNNNDDSEKKNFDLSDLDVQQYPDGIYKGSFDENHRRQGYGRMLYKDGREYKGSWNKDKREGKGVLLLIKGGDKYEGEFHQDKLEGKGVYKMKNGNSYVGGWKNGVRHGAGTYRYANGNMFEGFWKDGVKYGPGIFTYSDGSRRITTFEGAGQISKNVEGLVVSRDGRRMWKMTEVSPAEGRKIAEGLRETLSARMRPNLDVEGLLTHSIEPDSDDIDSCIEVTLEGGVMTEYPQDPFEKNNDIATLDAAKFFNLRQKKENKFDMHKKYPDGTYHGQLNFQNQRDGIGKMTYNTATPSIYDGQWKDDKKHGKGIQTWTTSGKIYSGEYRDDVKEGKGTMKYESGAKYIGNWKNGKMHGIGKYKYVDGTTDYCYFHESKAVGVGVRVSSDFSAVWRTLNDKIVSEITYQEAKRIMGEMGFPPPLKGEQF